MKNKQKLLIATTNKGKLQELSTFLSDLSVELVSLNDVGITDDVEETGETYKENSQKKAIFYAQRSNLPAIADDGGLEIDALGGAPGVKSRRWLGKEESDEILLKHLANVAKNLPNDNRKAWFKTVISFAMPDGKVWSVAGEVEGVIVENPHEKILKGYPYRSFFYLPEIKKYYHESELSDMEQKLYNHRYKAVQELKPIIEKAFDL